MTGGEPAVTGGEPAVTGGRRDRGGVVILGGYGAVGREVAGLLAPRIPGRVIVAGRDGERAAAFASRYGGALVPRRVRADHPDEVIAAIAGARVVVMAVETANAVVARACLARGIHYVDVSASAGVLASIERLDPLARRHWAGAVLSVGLAPGVTNLLARYCVDRLPGATSVDITVSLGLNGDHGADSLRWTVDNLVAGPDASETDGVGPAAGSGARRVRLPGTGPVTAYPFPFSDQVSLSRTLGVPTTTRLRFESELMTRLVFGLRSAGFFARFQGTRRRRALDAVLSRTRLGTDRFAVQAEASDRDGRRVVAAVTGRGECRATAAVTAEVVGALYEGRIDRGVHHLDELGPPDDLLGGLRRYGLTLHGIPG